MMKSTLHLPALVMAFLWLASLGQSAPAGTTVACPLVCHFEPPVCEPPSVSLITRPHGCLDNYERSLTY